MTIDVLITAIKAAAAPVLAPKYEIGRWDVSFAEETQSVVSHRLQLIFSKKVI
jgi:hypothetical protein